MSNMVLGFENNVLGATIAVSQSSPGLGPDKLQDDQCNAAASLQIPATAGSIRLTMPGAVPWRALGLFRTNLTAAAVVTWSLAADNSITVGGSVITVGGAVIAVGSGASTAAAVVPGYGQAVLVLPSEVSAASCTITLSDPGNPDGFLLIGGMYAGPVWQPRYNFSPQSVPGRTGSSAKTVTRAGGVLIRNDWTKRTFGLSMQSIVAAEAPTVMALDLFARQGGNVLFVPDPTSAWIAQEALFGEFEPSTGLVYSYATPAIRTYAATITERL